jgi:RHS repeat-associated protein
LPKFAEDCRQQNVQYGPADELLQWQYGLSAGSYTETRDYNNLLQLTEQSFVANNVGIYPFYDLKYVYSANQNNGRVLQMAERMSGETTNYTYDSLNRLATAGTAAWGQSFTYDGFGNLTEKNVTAGSAPMLRMVVNPANNQISTANYDFNGNLLYFQAGNSYAYDMENRLTSFISATTESYSYGPDNERIWRKKLDGTQEVYFYGVTGERLATYQPFQTGSPVLVETGRNIYFAGRAVSLAGQQYVGVDRLGTTRWSGDYLGSVTKFPYYPYGEEYTTTAQDRDKFGTYYRDGSTGLDYARNRYYASTYARFMSADPYRNSAGPGDPGSWNRYRYAGNDPVNFNDPSGLVGHCPAGTHTDSTGMGCEPDGVNFEYLISSPGLLFWLGVGGGSGGGGGGGEPQPKDRALLDAAAQRAMKALRDSKDCMDIFGDPKTRQGKFGPVNVLTNVENGTAFGSIVFKDLGANGPEAKVTANGIPWLTSSATITINSYSQATNLSWNSGNTDFNAETLLHELGHVYDLIRGSGGSEIKTPDALFGDKKSQYNDWLIDTKCFGGEFGFKNPYAQP